MTIKKKAVTILEVVVVIVIIGLVLAFAIPNYQRNVQRTYEKTAFDNLNVIKSALNLYKARNGQLPMVGMADVAAINSMLNTSIVAEDMTYACTCVIGASGPVFTCTAQSTAYPWALFFQTVSGSLIRCTAAGGCPTCGVAGSCYENEQDYVDF